MGVQEAAWELGGGVRVEGNPPWGGRDGMVCVVERGTNGPHDYQDFEIPPEMAEARAVAYLKAAAVARGERGLTAALNRVTAALGSPEPQQAAAPDVGRMVQQMRDALHMAGDAPWALLVDTASRLRGELERLEGLLRECGEHTSATEGRALHRIPDDVAAEMEDKRALQAALAGALGAESGPWPGLVELVRLMSDALSGKTQHDAAAEVVAPLREAMGPCLDNLSPAEVVRAAVNVLEAYGAVVLSDA